MTNSVKNAAENLLNTTGNEIKQTAQEVKNQFGFENSQSNAKTQESYSTTDMVRTMYAPEGGMVDINRIRQTHENEKNTPFNLDAVRGEISQHIPADKRRDVATANEPMFKNQQERGAFYAAQNLGTQVTQSEQKPQQEKPLKAAHERTSSETLAAAEPILPGSKGVKARVNMKSKMQKMILNRSKAKAETRGSQSIG